MPAYPGCPGIEAVNAAARLVSVARRHDHITPILATLSMAPEPGTDYRQPSDCQNCRYLHSSASSRPTSSSTSVLVVAMSRICTAVRRCCDCCEFGADYKCRDSTQIKEVPFGGRDMTAPYLWGKNSPKAPFRV